MPALTFSSFFVWAYSTRCTYFKPIYPSVTTVNGAMVFSHFTGAYAEAYLRGICLEEVLEQGWHSRLVRGLGAHKVPSSIPGFHTLISTSFLSV